MATVPLEKAFANLKVSAQALSAFEKEVVKTRFTIFHSIVDLKYFRWEAAFPPRYRSVLKQSSGDFFIHLVDDSNVVKPPELVDVDELNQSLPFPYARKSEAGSYMNKHPYDVPHLASLVVAQRRRGNLEGIDFVLGGSGLEVLAKSTTKGKTYLAYRVPSTNIIVFKKHSVYKNLPMDIGFQLERYVTGKPMSAIVGKQVSFVEHLQTMKVGDDNNVLFSAEVDAQQDDILFEVKSSLPRNWGTKLLFQMFSSGSAKLCHGDTANSRTPVLNKLVLYDLSELCQRQLNHGEEEMFEESILRNLASLKQRMAGVPAGKISKVKFTASKDLYLEPCEIKVLPSEAVVQEILKDSQRDDTAKSSNRLAR